MSGTDQKRPHETASADDENQAGTTKAGILSCGSETQEAKGSREFKGYSWRLILGVAGLIILLTVLFP